MRDKPFGHFHKKMFKGKTLIVGLGNRLRSDDGVGSLFAEKCIKSGMGRYVIDVGNKIENYLWKIVSYNPDTIIFVDSVSMGEKPGTVRFFNCDVLNSHTTSTHTISLKTVIEYLKAVINAKFYLLGIQPKTTKIGTKISMPVRNALNELVAAIRNMLK